MVGMAINASSSAPVKASGRSAGSAGRRRKGDQHQDADKAQHHRRQAGQDFDQRFEDLC